MKQLLLRIRKRYLDDIMKEKKKVEYRKDSKFWQQRIWPNTPLKEQKPLDLTDDPWIAVFLCGPRVHRRQILRIERIPRPSDFSEQGKKDVPTATCIALHLGRTLD